MYAIFFRSIFNCLLLILNLHSIDQAIPSGLHVRINLQTGVREAKLISDESPREKSSEETSIVMLEKEDEDMDGDSFQFHELEDSLKKISDDFPQKDDGFQVSTRSLFVPILLPLSTL